MADTNRVSLAMVEEATWGTNPGTALSEFNFTGESLNFSIDNITSNSIRSDRQVTDLIQTGAQAAGDINFELQYATVLSDFMQGALWDDEWHGCGSPDQATYTTSGANTIVAAAAGPTMTFAAGFVTLGINPAIGQQFVIAGSASNNGTHTVASVVLGATCVITTVGAVTDETMNSGAETAQFLIKESIVSIAGAGTDDIVFATAPDTITLGSNIVHDIVAGQWIEVSESGTGVPIGNNAGYHYVTGVVGNVISVGTTLTAQTYDDDPIATIKGARIRNGTTENSYWIERAHTDLSEYFSFEGMVINTMNMTFSANSIATGSFGFIGKTANLDPANATTGTGTNTAAATTNFMNAVANVGNIEIDGTAVSGCLIQEISISLNSNVRGLSSIGTLGFCDIGVGEIALTGNLNLYFVDSTYWDLYKAGTAFTLSWKVEDSAGNAYIFFLPKVKFSSDTVNAGSKNADVMENTSFQALMDPTLEFTLQVCRVAA